MLEITVAVEGVESSTAGPCRRRSHPKLYSRSLDARVPHPPSSWLCLRDIISVFCDAILGLEITNMKGVRWQSAYPCAGELRHSS